YDWDNELSTEPHLQAAGAGIIDGLPSAVVIARDSGRLVYSRSQSADGLHAWSCEIVDVFELQPYDVALSEADGKAAIFYWTWIGPELKFFLRDE
ncbi:MAG: hypothetical protein B1H03_04370, partial [Planctomycetales bacterium 4484_113]